MSTSEEEEFVPEEEAEEGIGALKKLRERLKKAVEEKQEYLDGWQRARADFANFKKDEMARSSEQELRLQTDMAEALIPTLDSFEMALKDKSFEAADANFKKGIEAVYGNLLKSLERAGIKRFDPAGDRFDPYKHEALREVPTDDASKDHFIESVHSAGYSVGDRVVRPAQVSVFTLTQ